MIVANFNVMVDTHIPVMLLMSLYMLEPPLLLLDLETEPAATMPDSPSLDIPRHRCIHHKHSAWKSSLLLIERRGWSDVSINRAVRSPARVCLRANCWTTKLFPMPLGPASWCHMNIKLRASDSLVLLYLLMQHVSTQAYGFPS